jgi:hypothetical protein
MIFRDILEKSLKELIMRGYWEWTKTKLKANAREIALICGMVGVGLCGFEFGFVQGVRHTSPPIVIEKAVAAHDTESVSGVTASVQGTQTEKTMNTTTTAAGRGTLPDTCPFVGSKNSNKYHAAGCAVAKRIKPENRICFTSEDDAKAKHYQPSCLKP